MSSVSAQPLAGGTHDRTSDPAYIASDIQGLCDECHRAHLAPEIVLYKRDLSPDAGSFSDLCYDCHSGSPPPWASTADDKSEAEASLHDFSDRPIGEDGGVCWACHDMHLPDETTVSYAGSSSGDYFTNFALWKRDIENDLNEYYQTRDLNTTSSSGGPNYLVGTSIFCYDCHGGDARQQGSLVDEFDQFTPDDSDFTTAPQDIAFAGDRDIADGDVGYYELPTGEEPDSGTSAPSMSSILNSPDDPDVVPGGHYVQSVMNNDGTTETDNYDVRDPDGNLLYRISVGDKLPCTLCHDPHLKESTVSTSPPDEMFFRRDIYAGEGVIVDRSSESYFSAKLEASGPPLTRNGAGGVGDGRRMCQYCHGTGDWDETQNPGPSGGIAPLIVDWTSRTTIYGILIRTATTPTGSTAFPPPNLVYHAKDDTQPPCASCHIHNNVKSANCAACHEYPPTRGAHERHAETQAAGGLEISCDVCHGVGAEQSDNFGHGVGGEDVISANITLLGQATYGTTRPSWYSSTWGTNGLATWTTLSNVTCQVRCHGNEVGSPDGDAPVSWYDAAGSPSYNNVCFNCHNMVTSSFELPATSGTLYQATNAAANYERPISGYSRGGHGDSGINNVAWFSDSAPGTAVPLSCSGGVGGGGAPRCHDSTMDHFPVRNDNPYRVSQDALDNRLPGYNTPAGSPQGPLTNLCTQTDCHPKVLGAGDFGFLSAIKHPNDHWPNTAPVETLLSYPAAQINQISAASTTTPAYDPVGRGTTVGVHIDRYVDHWGYWGATTTCTSTTNDDEPFMPLADSLLKQVGDSYNNDLDNANRLVNCVTCHNPHGSDLYVYGQGCGTATTLTSIPENNMLRLREQDDELCDACHR